MGFASDKTLIFSSKHRVRRVVGKDNYSNPSHLCVHILLPCNLATSVSKRFTSPPLKSGLACDSLQPIDCGESDSIGLASLQASASRISTVSPTLSPSPSSLSPSSFSFFLSPLPLVSCSLSLPLPSFPPSLLSLSPPSQNLQFSRQRSLD